MEYKIIRSNRKSMAVEVKLSGEIFARVPLSTSDSTVAEFIKSNEQWIEKTLKKQEKRRMSHPEPTPEEICELKRQAHLILPERVKHFSELTGLKCTGIKITSAKTRLGSCNGKNSICFSYLLMRYSPEVIDYVVLHELAHTHHHNHGPKFWNLVEKHMPNYKVRRDLLKG